MAPIQTPQSTEKELAHLQTLCEIMTERPSSFEEQLSLALKEGLTMLGLELGIVSHIIGNKYTILFFAPLTAQLVEGQEFDLSSTYCTMTVENKDVVAIDHMADSPYSGHPCYNTFNLESYIGVPILVDGLPYGTLNFSSSAPRASLFTEADKNFVRLMGRWVGARFSRRLQAEELKKYRAGLEDLVELRTTELKKTNERLKKEIAENKRRQSALLQQSLFLNTLIETIPIPVFYKDRNGKYLGCNKSFEEFCQKNKEEIVGKTVYEMGPKEIADKYFKKDKELLENPGIQQYEWKIRRGDGTVRDVVFEKATFKDEHGNIGGLIGSIFDITTRKIMEKRLLQSQKLEALGTLSNGIAHDFNNILSGIMGLTELVRLKLPADSQVQADLEKIYGAGLRAVDLIKQILTFSRCSEMNLQPVKISPIINEVLQLMKASLPRIIKIYSTILNEATVLADPTQLHQVLMNLCTNSGHAMRSTGGILEIRLDTVSIKSPENFSSAEERNNYFIKLEVIDNGVGISKESMDCIFDPFFSTKEPGEGTGLGLSVVHGIISSLGGTINVTSEPDIKTVFEILIPIIGDEII